MALANDSILVTPGSGATVATHTIGGKEHQVVMIAGDKGNIQGTKPSYLMYVGKAAVGASKLYFDLFNASGSGKVLEVNGIWAIPAGDVAVTGVLGVEIGVYRTSAVGTGGTAHTYNGGSTLAGITITPKDTANAALPAQVTARMGPSGGATIAAVLCGQYVFTEETNQATYQAQWQNLLPAQPNDLQTLTINTGEGILVKQGTVAGVGSIAYLVDFSVV